MEISRNLLAGALGALGKLVTRTSPVEAYRSVLIEGEENKISFQTAGNEESVTFTMDCENAGVFRIAVNFDAFRTAVKAGKNKTVVLDPDAESLGVDNTLLMASRVEWPEIGGTADSAATAELPENFVGALATVAPIVNRSEPRRALQGIHLCREGVVTTNGKELLHIEMPLEVDPLTMPFPHALLATKSAEGGMLTTWSKGDQRYFTIALGCWEWTAKVVPPMGGANSVSRRTRRTQDTFTFSATVRASGESNSPLSRSSCLRQARAMALAGGSLIICMFVGQFRVEDPLTTAVVAEFGGKLIWGRPSRHRFTTPNRRGPGSK